MNGFVPLRSVSTRRRVTYRVLLCALLCSLLGAWAFVVLSAEDVPSSRPAVVQPLEVDVVSLASAHLPSGMLPLGAVRLPSGELLALPLPEGAKVGETLSFSLLREPLPEAFVSPPSYVDSPLGPLASSWPDVDPPSVPADWVRALQLGILVLGFCGCIVLLIASVLPLAADTPSSSKELALLLRSGLPSDSALGLSLVSGALRPAGLSLVLARLVLLSLFAAGSFETFVWARAVEPPLIAGLLATLGLSGLLLLSSAASGLLGDRLVRRWNVFRLRRLLPAEALPAWVVFTPLGAHLRRRLSRELSPEAFETFEVLAREDVYTFRELRLAAPALVSS